MRSFFNFLNEARETEASKKAKAQGLRYDSEKGAYVDRQGNIKARTVDGKLVFTSERGPAKAEKEEDPGIKRPDLVSDKKKPGEEEIEGGKKDEGEEGEGGDRAGDTVTLVFGRFNPPTIGHKKLLDGAAKVAKGDLRIYPSRSQDPKKNPLEPGAKVEVMKKMFPDYSDDIINDADIKSIFDALKLADEEGYGNVQIVVGSDRVTEFDNLAQKYNGELYDFESIDTISAGDRDADAAGVEGMSASKMRKAAADDDYETFRSGTPESLDDKATKALFNTLRKSMKVSEGWNLWEIAPKFDWKNLRENYITGKIFKVNQLVENLNTGLIGRIVRRGTNHLICVTEDDIMFKAWVRDLREYTEVKMSRKMRTPKKPNTLVGTDGYFKYAADLTPGHEKGGKNLQDGGKAYSGQKQESYGFSFINRYRKNNK